MALSPTFPSKDKFDPTQPILPNLSPSEELHVLMARIAVLNRANSVSSSVARFEVFGQDGNGESVGDEFCLDEEGQQQEDRRTPTMDANAEQLAKMQNEIMEIGKWVKQQQEKEQKEKEQTEKELLKFRMNFWDPTVCHGDIAFIGNDRLTIRKNKNNSDECSIFAKRPITLNKFSANGIFYFEISLKQKKTHSVDFGFAFKKLPESDDETICNSSGSYAWESGGYFWINGSLEGSNANYCFHCRDVVGIGVNLANRQMIFTKNGLRLDSSDLFIHPSSAVDELFPFVSLWNFGKEIEANFGPNFNFDLSSL